jgi:hypothetical protein
VIVIPGDAAEAKLPSKLLQYREWVCSSYWTLLISPSEEILAQLFIVSAVSVVDDQAPIYGDGWTYTRLMPIPDVQDPNSNVSGSTNYLRVCVRQPNRGKCPRCWRYARESSKDVCIRCEHSIEQFTS